MKNSVDGKVSFKADIISGRKKAELVVFEAREYAQNIMATMRESLLVLDDNLKVVSANDSFYKTFEVTSKETEGNVIYDLGNSQWDIPKLHELLEKIIPEQSFFADFEVEHDFPKIGSKIMLLNARQIHQKVTSHDLQEPLRMVASYVLLLERRYKGKLDADADEFIAYAVDGANRMRGLIDDLLSYSRVGKLKKPFEPINVETTLDTVLMNLKETIADNGAVVTHDKLPEVVADGEQLVQLFQNLIGNAIKFHGKDPPRVHVSALVEETEYLFSVRDNGIGIAPEYFDRLFKIFQRLHTREEYPGTGIGLAICRRIVERHGGRIWIESQVGKGSTIYFTLSKTK